VNTGFWFDGVGYLSFYSGVYANPTPGVGGGCPRTRRYLRYRLGEAALLQLNFLAVRRAGGFGLRELSRLGGFTMGVLVLR